MHSVESTQTNIETRRILIIIILTHTTKKKVVFSTLISPRYSQAWTFFCMNHNFATFIGVKNILNKYSTYISVDNYNDATFIIEVKQILKMPHL